MSQIFHGHEVPTRENGTVETSWDLCINVYYRQGARNLWGSMGAVDLLFVGYVIRRMVDHGRLEAWP
jgi:hypothetical protein